MSDRQSFTQAVYDYLTARPGEWVSTNTLREIGGRDAWRTRLSEARVRLRREAGDWTHDPIQNKQVKRKVDGREWTDSYYKFVPFPSESVTLRVDENGQQVFL